MTTPLAKGVLFLGNLPFFLKRAVRIPFPASLSFLFKKESYSLAKKTLVPKSQLVTQTALGSEAISEKIGFLP